MLAPSITYAWDDLSPGESLDLIIGEPVSLVRWLSGEVVVRVHANEMSADAGSGMTVAVEGISRSRDEPETTFVAAELMSVDLDSAAGVGALLPHELKWPWTDLARLRLTLRQASARAVSQSARISVLLSLHTRNGR